MHPRSGSVGSLILVKIYTVSSERGDALDIRVWQGLRGSRCPFHATVSSDWNLLFKSDPAPSVASALENARDFLVAGAQVG